MICALMLDLDDAPDFPGGTAQVLGRPVAAYPLLSARATGMIPRHYVVTASPAVKTVARQDSAAIIDPPELKPGQPACEAFLQRGYKAVVDDLKLDNQQLDMLVVFLANAPAITAAPLVEGIEALQGRPELDSAVTVRAARRWHPSFAQREEGGLLESWASQSAEPKGEVWYPDWGAQLVRARCLDGSVKGRQPLPWLGKKVLPIKQQGAGPLDFRWQLPALEYWLQKNGYPDLGPELQPQPKLQPAPKTDRR